MMHATTAVTDHSGIAASHGAGARPARLAEQHGLIRQGSRGWALLYALWTLPPLITTASIVAFQGTTSGWTTTLVGQIVYYYFFASICPAVYRLTRHLSARSHGLTTIVFSYAAAGVLIVTLASLLLATSRSIRGADGITLAAAIAEEFTTPQGQARFFPHFFNYILVVAAMQGIRLDRERRLESARANSLLLQTRELESQLGRARLRALEMQIHPHFLFNTLNSIASLIEAKRDEEAYRAVALLGGLLRYTVDRPARGMIALVEEIAFLRDYLDLELLRFSDRLTVAFDVDRDCTLIPVPAMLLQPLVENAVRHGFSDDGEASSIHLRAHRRQDLLIVEIEDDGAGLPRDWSLDRNAGVGLRNVRDRLATTFGPRSSLAVHPRSPRGVIARMEIPIASSENTRA